MPRIIRLILVMLLLLFTCFFCRPDSPGGRGDTATDVQAHRGG